MKISIMIKLVVLLGLIATVYTCKDNSVQCQDYKVRLNICFNKNTDFGKKHCRKTCGFCTDGGTGGNGGSGGAGQCGVSKVAQSRVVEGVEAQAGAWPWIASVQTSRGSHFCGGTILTPNWVLTASHCVESHRDPRGVRVVLGATDRSKKESSQQVIGVKRIIMHEKYKQGGRGFLLLADMALLELSSPARMNDLVTPPCMPQQNVYPTVGKNCYIAGWGTTSYPGNIPKKLQQAKLPVVGTPHKGCHNDQENVCVGYGFGKQSNGRQHPNACGGDSGGPLVCQRSDGKWQLEGVASYVNTYCKYYTAYSPVNKYLSWIKRYVPL